MLFPNAISYLAFHMIFCSHFPINFLGEIYDLLLLPVDPGIAQNFHG